MATDPVRRVRSIQHAPPVTFGVREHLVKLAGLDPSTDIPYVTVTLDWTPDGEEPGRRFSREAYEREIKAAIDAHGPRGDVFDSLTMDAERIAEFLDDELDPATQGVFILSCSAKDIFEPVLVALPVPTEVWIGPVPVVTALARLVDDHPAYAVLLANQQEAVLSKIRRGARGRSVQMESNLWPRRTQQGGWSQQRYQARVDERVNAFARTIAEVTEKALRDEEIDTLIIAGDEVMTSAIDSVASHDFKSRLLDTIRIENTASEQDKIDLTMPIVAQAERDREVEIVQQLADNIGVNGAGVGGAKGVIEALNSGQVGTLVLADDFAGKGWADYTMDVYGVGNLPTNHPVGGEINNLVEIDLAQEFVRLAVRTGADIDIIHSAVSFEEFEAEHEDEEIPMEAGQEPPRTEAAQLLAEYDGVGALLRFTIDDAEPHAEA